MTQPAQQQSPPGREAPLEPQADHGEDSYTGSGRLDGKATLITGADSGIGRAVALAFAREGADVLISYLEEHEDAAETERLVTEAGRRAVTVAGDVGLAPHCRDLVGRTVEEFGRLDVLVNNAAFQMTRPEPEEIPDEEWEHTFATNVHGMFYLTKAALPHMESGASIINSSSVNSAHPKPPLLAYAASKAAIANFSGNLAQTLGERGIRVNSVAPGPVWTPLIPSTMPPDSVESFGQNAPLGRPAQPAELAPVYVMLASDEASYVSGARVEVTGGTPVL